MQNTFFSLFFIILFIHLLLNEQSLSAQNSKITTLKNQLVQAKADTSKVKILNKLSKSYKRLNLDSALYFVKEAEALTELLAYSKGLADSYNNYGNIYKNQGYYLLAMNYYQKSMKISEEINYKKNLGKLYNNIGILYLIQQEYDQSMEYYKKSLKIKDELGDEKGKTYCYNNISTIYDIKKDYTRALEYINKSLVIRQKLKDSSGISVCYQFLGRINLHSENFKEAEYFYNLAIDLKKKSSDQFGIAQTMYNIASLKMAVGNSTINLTEKKKYYNEAISFALQSLEISERIGALNVQRYAHNTLYEANMALQDYKKAIKYKNSYDLLKDSLFSIEKLKQINDIEAKYRFEKKQLQVEKLEKEFELRSANIKSLQNQRILLIIVLSLFIVFIVGLLLARKRLRSKNGVIFKKNNKINAQNEEILHQNDVLLKYQNHLEEMIKEQTSDIVAAKEKAEHADKLKTAFLENLSHEIRTPLNAIVGFSSLIALSENIPDLEKGFIEKIDQGSESLLKIIDSIMHVSKIQLGEYQVSLIELNLNKLINQLFEEFKLCDEYKNKNELKLKTKISQMLSNKIIYSDFDGIRTVLFNLIDNAIKFTEKGTVEFGCHIVPTSFISEKEENDTQMVQFFVKDTGIGIIEEDIQFVFDKFRKIDMGKSKLYRGLGLGLSIAKNMVEQLGGKIWLESEINKGTTFYFTIPYKTVTEEY